MNTVLDFQEIKKEDVMTAGGKGANLGEMTAAGITVPGGFVVTADAYKAFIKENHLEEMFRKELTEAGKDEAKLLDAAKKFRHAISKGKLPEEVEKAVREKYAQLGEQARVAVRSSATAEDLPDASFAGQQETYLNVRGAEAVLTQIRNCYASLWGNRAVCYRSNQGYDQLSVALAVVIQKMVESEKAGVLFTVNPINRNPDEMQINASYGLGESVVSGKVTADFTGKGSYVLTAVEQESSDAVETAYESLYVGRPEGEKLTVTFSLTDAAYPVPIEQLNKGKLTLNVTLPDYLKYSDIRVLTVDKEGQLENISYTGEEGKISFPVTHTGDYVFLSVSDSKVYGQTKVNGGQAVIERNKDFGIE